MAHPFFIENYPRNNCISISISVIGVFHRKMFKAAGILCKDEVYGSLHNAKVTSNLDLYLYVTANSIGDQTKVIHCKFWQSIKLV